MKFCIDCKHSKKGEDLIYRCAVDPKPKSMVTGEDKGFFLCKTAREAFGVTSCGGEARWFVPKEKVKK